MLILQIQVHVLAVDWFFCIDEPVDGGDEYFKDEFDEADDDDDPHVSFRETL